MNFAADYPELALSDEDPYPDLPWLEPAQLRNGDVLMMLGEGFAKIHGIPIPISWLIRHLDGGAYSHSAMLTLREGEPMVWDHSDSMELHPVSLEVGIRDHAWCHVYRFRKHGEPLGSDRYPVAPLVNVLDGHEGDPYDMYLLLMAGVVAVVSRMPENAALRLALRLALNAVVTLIEYLLDEKDIRKGALICTAVTGLTHWEPENGTPHDYALEVDIERRRGAPQADPAWERLMRRIEALLSRIWEDFPEALRAYRRTVNQGNAHWVDAGSDGLPVNLVSPSDLEFSRTLQRVGKLRVP